VFAGIGEFTIHREFVSANYQRILDAARLRVRAWEQAHR
jgi:hypothetical protein